MSRITSLTELDALYGEPVPASLAKVADRVIPTYRALIEAAPFCVLATAGPGGVDASPRGDAPGFVRVEDERTLMLPDRRGNNRADTLRNLVTDPRLALLFFIPGVGETLRVNGTGEVHADAALGERFAVQGKTPRTVLVVRVAEVYFQCSRAVLRARLWEPESRVERASLPTPGRILAEVSAGRIGAEYDEGLQERLRANLY
jgi:PPOX class probable FMN-dependent enzyme